MTVDPPSGPITLLPLAGLFLMLYSALFAAERLHLLRGGEPRLDLDATDAGGPAEGAA